MGDAPACSARTNSSPTPGAMKCSTKWDRETTKSQVSLQIPAEGRIILAAGTRSIFAASGFPCLASMVAPRDQEPLTLAKQGEEALSMPG